MSRLAHNSDYHMALIDAQSMLNEGHSHEDVLTELIKSEHDLSATAEEQEPRNLAKMILMIVKMKPQPQSNI